MCILEPIGMIIFHYVGIMYAENYSIGMTFVHYAGITYAEKITLSWFTWNSTLNLNIVSGINLWAVIQSVVNKDVFSLFRSSYAVVFLRKVVLKTCSKFTNILKNVELLETWSIAAQQKFYFENPFSEYEICYLHIYTMFSFKDFFVESKQYGNNCAVVLYYK